MYYEDEISIEEVRRRHEARKRRRKKRRQQRMILRGITGGVLLLIVILISTGIYHLIKSRTAEDEVMAYEMKYIAEAPDFMVELLDVNEYSRPGTELSQVKGIVIHYTANPGTSAEQNRNYFEGLSESGETYASSHFVIGMEGEIIQCIPCNEIAYASNDRNSDTVSIECCIPDDTGKFADATYQSLIKLTTWLMGRYDLSTDDVIRHYDVTGKLCPKYYVEDEGAWEQLKADMQAYIDTYGIAKTEEIK